MIYREGTTKGLPLTLALTTMTTIVKRWLTKLFHSHVFPVTRSDSDSLPILERRGPLEAPESVCQSLCSYGFCSHGHARGCAALHVQTMARRRTKCLTSSKGLREEPESDESRHVPMEKILLSLLHEPMEENSMTIPSRTSTLSALHLSQRWLTAACYWAWARTTGPNLPLAYQ